MLDCRSAGRIPVLGCRKKNHCCNPAMFQMQSCHNPVAIYDPNKAAAACLATLAGAQLQSSCSPSGTQLQSSWNPAAVHRNPVTLQLQPSRGPPPPSRGPPATQLRSTRNPAAVHLQPSRGPAQPSRSPPASQPWSACNPVIVCLQPSRSHVRSSAVQLQSNTGLPCFKCSPVGSQPLSWKECRVWRVAT